MIFWGVYLKFSFSGVQFLKLANFNSHKPFTRLESCYEGIDWGGIDESKIRRCPW